MAFFQKRGTDESLPRNDRGRGSFDDYSYGLSAKNAKVTMTLANSDPFQDELRTILESGETNAETAISPRSMEQERVDAPIEVRLFTGRRVSGVVGSTPEALVRVGSELVAVAEGDPALARVVELRALGRAGRIAPAFEGAALATLPSELRAPHPVAAYVPGPLDPAALGDSTGLLAGTLALCASLAPDNTVLHLELALSGQWRPALDEPRLREAWQSFVSSAIGSRLGLEVAALSVDVHGSESLLTLRTDLDAGAFVAGVLGLLAGTVEDASEGP